MKLFITTVGILVLSFFLTDGKSSSQGVVINDRIVNTYTESEILLHHLVSRIKLSRCEVLLLSINQDLEMAQRDDVEPISLSFSEMLHNLDSLDCEIKTPKNCGDK